MIWSRAFRQLFVLACGFSLATSARAVTGEDFDYHGYLRTGIGSDTKGGDQVCYRQSGVPGNEFRLGNECGIYGENYFQAYTPRAKQANGEFFRANFNFSYNPAGKNMSEPANIGVFGAFIEAGRLLGGDETIWVGKRYYRDSDTHLDDFFYFADTSGNGAGIQNVRWLSGKFSLAMLMENETETNTVGGTSVPVTTQNGRPKTTLLDARLFEIPLDEHNRLNFWLGFAKATGGGTDVNTGAQYKNAHGIVAGIKEQFQTEAGSNHVAIVYGTGLMQGMNLSGSFGADPTQLNGGGFQQNARRLRLVEEFTFQPSARFALAFAFIHETWNPGGAGMNTGRWVSVGARPVYFFSDHYSVMLEAGASNVKPAATGRQAGVPLFRVTLAPQITPKSEFFSRPALRAFYTQSFLNGVSHGGYGFQGEVWF